MQDPAWLTGHRPVASSTMEANVDSDGRIVVPGRAARLITEDGALVATGEATIDDETLFGLIDAGRRQAMLCHSPSGTRRSCA